MIVWYYGPAYNVEWVQQWVREFLSCRDEMIWISTEPEDKSASVQADVLITDQWDWLKKQRGSVFTVFLQDSLRWGRTELARLIEESSQHPLPDVWIDIQNVSMYKPPERLCAMQLFIPPRLRALASTVETKFPADEWAPAFPAWLSEEEKTCMDRLFEQHSFSHQPPSHPDRARWTNTGFDADTSRWWFEHCLSWADWTANPAIQVERDRIQSTWSKKWQGHLEQIAVQSAMMWFRLGKPEQAQRELAAVGIDLTSPELSSRHALLSYTWVVTQMQNQPEQTQRIAEQQVTLRNDDPEHVARWTNILLSIESKRWTMVNIVRDPLIPLFRRLFGQAGGMLRLRVTEFVSYIVPHLPLTLVLNLDRRPDRWRNMQMQFAALNLPLHVQRFSAFDGKLRTDQLNQYLDKINPRFFRVSQTLLTAGERGCWATHIQAWELAAQCDVDLVMTEDDAIVGPIYTRDLPILVATLQRAAPAVDLCWLGYHMYAVDRGIKMLDFSATQIVPLARHLPVAARVGGTYAYYVSATGARKMLTLLRAEPKAGTKTAIDNWMFHLPPKDLNQFCPLNPLVWSEFEGDAPTRRRIDSDIVHSNLYQ